jgi:hypothetical protein
MDAGAVSVAQAPDDISLLLEYHDQQRAVVRRDQFGLQEEYDG